MNEKSGSGTRFLILFRSEAGERLARIVIDSLRAFAGPLRDSEVWAFVLDPDRASHVLPGIEGVHRFPLAVEGGCPLYPFAEKVYACARAEEMAAPEIRSLVWLSLDCLVINPPVLFDLGPSAHGSSADAAFRPVHHRNVGSPAHQPPDDFWRAIYRALGIEDMPYTVESFVDGQTLRPYFNTHCFALNPAAGLGRAWWAHFKAMASDQAFQAGPCRDELHQIFLHQAILSTLVAKLLPWERVRLLPPEYNYPLNLLNEMPSDRRAPALNSLVNAVYEHAFPWTEIEVEEPLRSWLMDEGCRMRRAAHRRHVQRPPRVKGVKTMTRTPMLAAIGIALTLTLLLGGCGQPVATPTIEAKPSSAVQERIRSVEHGLIAVTAEGELELGDPKTLAERMEHYGVPGVSIAVINDYQLEWARGYGILEAGGDERVTTDSLFHAGSIAKPVSAAAALVLVEQGLLDLDQDVNDKLVSWQVPLNEYTTEEKVTLRRLLSQSSGLTDGFPMRSASDPEFDWWVASEGETPTITIQQLLEAQPPADDGSPTRVTRVPGTAYQYSNLGYGVVQLLMTDATHRPFSELMQETVLGPVGMASSTFEQPLPEELRDRATTEHYVNGQPFEGKRHHFPFLAGGGLWTTPSDLARFAIEIMRARAGESDLLLSQEMAGEMLTSQIDVPESFFSDSYGLGFDLADEGQEFRFMHTGGTWGSTCLLWVYPETGQGAVIMTNSASGEGAIRFEILLSIAAEYGWPLALLPFEIVDLVVVVAANLFNLLMASIFFTRPRGWKRFERAAGLVMVGMALPLGAAVILNALGKRDWWFIVLPLPLILHCVVELLLGYILKLDFRKTRLLGPYLALFYLGQMGLIGYAFVAEPAYGFVTLATYFLCLGATRYAHSKGVG